LLAEILAVASFFCFSLTFHEGQSIHPHLQPVPKPLSAPSLVADMTFMRCILLMANMERSLLELGKQLYTKMIEAAMKLLTCF